MLTDIDISVVGESSVKDELREGNSNPLGGLVIRVNRQDVVGGCVAGPRVWIAEHLLCQLGAVGSIVSGERVVITCYNGPTYFVLEPAAPGEIVVSWCQLESSVDNLDARREFEPSVRVKMAAWVSAVVRAARDFLSVANEANPDLEDDPYIVDICEAIREIEAEFPEYVGDVGE